MKKGRSVPINLIDRLRILKGIYVLRLVILFSLLLSVLFAPTPAYAASSYVNSTTAIPTTSGSYGAGTIIDITVNFNMAETVTYVSGWPRLKLNTTPTAYANYISGSGTANIVFRYTVASGENSTRLDYFATTSLETNGSTIRNAGTNANVTLNTLCSLGDQLCYSKTIVIDTTAPNTPTIGTFTPTGGTVTAGYLNSTNTGFTLTFTSPAAEYAGTAHLYVGSSLLATDITTTVSAGNTIYTLTGNAQSITDLGADGAKALTVKIIDTAGNTSSASGASNITLDKTAPNAPTIGTFTPTGGTVTAGYLNNTNTGFTQKFTTPGTEYAGTAHLYVGDVLLNTDVTVAVSAADTEYTLTGNTTSITDLGADGAKALTVKIIDTAGNTSSASDASNITKDTIATATITYSTESSMIKCNGLVTIPLYEK